MHCSACGAEVVQEAVYCHQCGHRIDEPGGSPASDRSDPHAGGGDARQRLEEGVADRQRRNDDDTEREVWEGRYSPKAMMGAWVLTVLVTLVLLIVAVLYREHGWVLIVAAVAIPLLWLYQLARLAYRRMSVRYRLTNQRLIHESGILTRTTDRIETIDMDDITFAQTFFERFMGVGTVIISSSDRSHPELRLVGIEEVKQVADQMDDVRRAERRRRGLHIESI